MARRTKQEAEATRVQILDAAEHVFHAQGVSRATLAEVAKEAGVSRGAIYWYFENKIDLFQAMLERMRLPLEELARASESEDEPNPLGCMRELLIQVLTRLAQDPQTQRIHDILRYKCEYTGELLGLRERMRALCGESDQRIAKALANAVAKGQLPAQLDCPRAAVCLHAFIAGIEANWILAPKYDLAAQAAAMVDAVLDMLRSSPALRRPS
ncbi:TetR family transcriptional regulator [Pseudomonas sp. NCHU5208]|uniref:TetR family transcriptional regulator n=1 Tax=unclassified Pseudomonas TaxID=196821 RepID=UPI003F97BC98